MLDPPYYVPGDEPDAGCVVYFIQSKLGGPIKIGTSTERGLESRLASIQTGHPEPLWVCSTVPGDSRYERELHAHFGAYRLAGEWFAGTKELVEFAHAKPKRLATIGFSEQRQRDKVFQAGRSHGYRDASEWYAKAFANLIGNQFEEAELRLIVDQLAALIEPREAVA